MKNKMKTMSCREMGGDCDMTFSAGTSADMAKKMTLHVTKEHPEIAEEFENMTPEEHAEWEKEFHASWDKAENEEEE